MHRKKANISSTWIRELFSN